jgi:hypothetical protein
MPDDFGESRRDLIWRRACRPFEFNDPSASPVFLEQFGRDWCWEVNDLSTLARHLVCRRGYTISTNK